MPADSVSIPQKLNKKIKDDGTTAGEIPDNAPRALFHPFHPRPDRDTGDCPTLDILPATLEHGGIS